MPLSLERVGDELRARLDDEPVVEEREVLALRYDTIRYDTIRYYTILYYTIILPLYSSKNGRSSWSRAVPRTFSHSVNAQDMWYNVSKT